MATYLIPALTLIAAGFRPFIWDVEGQHALFEASMIRLLIDDRGCSAEIAHESFLEDVFAEGLEDLTDTAALEIGAVVEPEPEPEPRFPEKFDFKAHLRRLNALAKA